MKKYALALALLPLLLSPALAQETLFEARDFALAAGLTPKSGVRDAERRYGPGVAMEPGVKFLVPGSHAEPWMTFIPGVSVYVDCDEAPALPDDAVARLCRIAQNADWRKGLAALQTALSKGAVTPGMKDNAAAPRPQQAEHAPGARVDDDADDEEDNFSEVVRTFRLNGRPIQVAACPRIKTRDGGVWHAGVMVTWKPS